jgi:hypothetical protein
MLSDFSEYPLLGDVSKPAKQKLNGQKCDAG